ncbi:hypothetical protein [Nostoc sp. FACHB-110]|nr:hypothetical protein [Nostoc sp. FACHB-110]
MNALWIPTTFVRKKQRRSLSCPDGAIAFPFIQGVTLWLTEH